MKSWQCMSSIQNRSSYVLEGITREGPPGTWLSGGVGYCIAPGRHQFANLAW